jgi:hypothetical protein
MISFYNSFVFHFCRTLIFCYPNPYVFAIQTLMFLLSKPIILGLAATVQDVLMELEDFEYIFKADGNKVIEAVKLSRTVFYSNFQFDHPRSL